MRLGETSKIPEKTWHCEKKRRRRRGRREGRTAPGSLGK